MKSQRGCLIMNKTDQRIFEALDYMYILGHFETYQDAINLFYRYADRREPIPEEMKTKMVEAIRLRRHDGRMRSII